MIESYSFGQMVVDGQEYRKDLMILPDGEIVHPWWRESGHRLTEDDITEILNTSPSVLVIGTGSYGMMKPDRALPAKLESGNIPVVALPTKKAVKEYNELLNRGEKVAACFHLTC